MENRPKVGIAVIIRKDNKILLGKRKNAHGNGTRSTPGGHLEFGESLEECAIREVAEETGIKIQNPLFTTITNDFFHKEEKHYITLYMIVDVEACEPQVMEPQKCECWEWHDWNNLPEPLFIPIQNLLKTDFHPFPHLAK